MGEAKHPSKEAVRRMKEIQLLVHCE
jgi:hypothetical protein